MFVPVYLFFFFFFFNDPATTEIYTLSLHDALPISPEASAGILAGLDQRGIEFWPERSEEHTSELQSQFHLVCRLLLEKKNKYNSSPRASISHTTDVQKLRRHRGR